MCKEMERRTRMTITQHKQIQASVLLLPDQMSTEWRKHLTEGVQKSLLGKCSFEHGYIIDIHNVTKILDHQIARLDGNVRFQVEIDATVLRPNVGDRTDAVVEMIFPHGIFCCYRKLRMMLPLSKCPNYSLRQDFSQISLVNSTTKATIRKGDTIHIIVEDVRFENDLYSCIVSLSPDTTVV